MFNHVQTAVIKNKFVEAIQAYQTVEQQYRQKYKQRMERQFKIGVFPIANTPLSFLSLHFFSQTGC